jgi:hypothetical protein
LIVNEKKRCKSAYSFFSVAFSAASAVSLCACQRARSVRSQDLKAQLGAPELQLRALLREYCAKEKVAPTHTNVKGEERLCLSPARCFFPGKLYTAISTVLFLKYGFRSLSLSLSLCWRLRSLQSFF